jgi:hypothetical protein
MSRVDERIRDEARRLDRPVDASGVLERVAARKSRRRATRRVQVVALAVAVLSGTALGGYGLTRLIGPAGDPAPGQFPDPSVPPPNETATPTGIICDGSRLRGDLDGDGLMDFVDVYFRQVSRGDCQIGPDEVVAYEAHVVFGREGETMFAAEPQPLQECGTPFGCRVIAAPDIDRDGDAEVAIRTGFGGGAYRTALYRLDPDWNLGDPALERLRIAPPGDPWHEEFGHLPGPASLRDGDGGEHVHHIGCRTASGRSLLDVVTWLHDEASDEWWMHRASFELRGTELVLWETEDERFAYLGGLPPGTDPCISEVV